MMRALAGTWWLVTRPAVWLLLALIRLYQLTISRMLPHGTCRFEPSCSRYAQQALQQRDLISALLLTVWRVARCNPFCQGGYDPVPERGFPTWRRD